MNKYLPIIAIIFAALLWSLDGFLRQTLYSVSSFLIVTIEHVLGAIIFFPFLIRGKQEIVKMGQSYFVTFKVSKSHYEQLVYDVLMYDLEKPPKNRLRKVVFKDYNMLTVAEKLSIVGKLIGKSKLSDAEIYDAMLLINDNNEKITVSKLAKLLKCSARTIYRNMSNELKKEKELLNKQL